MCSKVPTERANWNKLFWSLFQNFRITRTTRTNFETAEGHTQTQKQLSSDSDRKNHSNQLQHRSEAIAEIESLHMRLSEMAASQTHMQAQIELQRSAMEARTECILCMSVERNTVFFPCMHIGCCYRCAAALEICPQCRAPITQVARVYSLWPQCASLLFSNSPCNISISCTYDLFRLLSSGSSPLKEAATGSSVFLAVAVCTVATDSEIVRWYQRLQYCWWTDGSENTYDNHWF